MSEESRLIAESIGVCVAADRKARERQADVERVAERLLGTVEYVLVPVWDKNMYGVAYKSGEGSEPRTIDAHRAFGLAESFVSLRDRRREEAK